MSTESFTNKMRLTDYLLCWLGFVLFFTVAGFFLGFMLAMYFGLAELLPLCLIAFSSFGMVVGIFAVILQRASNRELHPPVYSNTVDAEKTEVVSKAVLKSVGWGKRDYFHIMLLCLAVCLAVGLYFGMVFSQMTHSAVKVGDCLLVGLEFGFVAGLVVVFFHYFKNLRHLRPLPSAQLRSRHK